ncbi:suppressor of los1-1 [Coemansia erecta]|uniref:6-phosphogluconolactonase n=1 Tax=Coemansia asiatica TaxID=1052880 RepID=A0A9W7XJ06_9FUNG|nr:suppressor of los1-1 [Coemansia asiatica]KAJ2857443.1 suppressor of los1-1 [Coemansia erecta]
MPQAKVFSFASTDDVSHALDKFLEDASRESIARSGKFTIAFSGGSLPATASKYLQHNTKIDFTRWHVFFADERCVKHNDADSNFKLVKDELLDKLASDGKIPANQVHSISESLVNDSEKAASDYQQKIAQVFAVIGDDNSQSTVLPEFDCILLGIGPDGHTCSLFPGFPQLDEKVKWVTHIDNSPKPPPSRITLTLPVVNNARKVAFVVTGAGKRTTIRDIVDKRDLSLPAARVAMSVDPVYWFVDDAAAQDLDVVKPSEFKL